MNVLIMLDGSDMDVGIMDLDDIDMNVVIMEESIKKIFVLGVFSFCVFFNIGMLLIESERVK